jgi:hypothetical protein
MPSTGTTGFDLNFAQAEEQWSCNLDFDGCLADGIVWLGDHWSWEESWDQELRCMGSGQIHTDQCAFCLNSVVCL